MRRGGIAASFAASPTLVGAITTLIAVVAVFLAYNANHGLPFVASYRISAIVPNAQSLVPGNEVRIGGVLVGTVEEITPIQRPDGGVDAKLDLRLDQSAKPIPVNSTVVIRAKSALGLKYLEINKGDSSKSYPDGATISRKHAKPETIDLDQVLNTFNEPTRLAIQRNLLEFGNALIGRGPAINEAIGNLKPLLNRLRPVMRVLASPRTGLAEFFRALEATSAEVAPVAETQARLFVSLDTTFRAFASIARPFLQETISKTPPTLDTANRALPVIRPFLAHSATLFADLRPGVRALTEAAPVLSRAITVGIPALRRSPALNAQLPPTANSLLAFSQDAGVRNGIDRLTKSNEKDLGPLLSFVTPAQTRLQLRDAPVPQRGERAEPRRRRSGTGSASSCSRPRRGRTTRAPLRASRRTAAGRSPTPTTSTRTRTRTRLLRGRRMRVRGRATSPSSKGKTGHRQRSRQPGHRDAGQIPSQLHAKP